MKIHPPFWASPARNQDFTAPSSLGGAPTSICHFFCPSVCLFICPSVCRTPYLQNRTSSNYNLWYTCVKWWYLRAWFSFFWNFDFLDCYGSKRAKNKPKMKNNNYIHNMLYISNSIAYDHDFWYTCVKWYYLKVFFSFFWNFHFSGKLGG